MESWFFLWLFLGTLAGGLVPLLAGGSHRILHLLLCLAAGFFLGVVFLHLLPELDHGGQTGSALWTWVLGGLLLVLVLDLGIFGKQSHAAVGWATLIGLSVHGCATGLSLGVMSEVTDAFLVAMLAHKFGEAFSLSSALRFTVARRRLVAAIVASFSLVAPISMWIGASVRDGLPADFAPVISAIAAGSFLYVAVGDLLPEVFHEPEDRGLKLVLLLAGVAFAALAQADTHAHGVEAVPAGHEALLVEWLESALRLFIDAAPFLLLGFLAAALLRGLIPARWLARLLGRQDMGAILRAAAIGAPLPLCSCSVLPTAISLHRRGASKPATVSFLVSTPETGVDSIGVTWALMDPFMTVVRPLAAVVSGVVAGLMTRVFGSESAETTEAATRHDEAGQLLEEDVRPAGQRLREALRYSFVDILDDIMPSMLVGLGLGALVSVLLPEGALAAPWAQGWPAYLLAAIIGVPIYVCASASTPIAVALILKGLSPGAALVFLLVGPATNLGSLLVLRRALGVRVVWTYLGSIVACALAFGMVVDVWYAAHTPIRVRSGDLAAEAAGFLEVVSAAVLAALTAGALWRRYRQLAASGAVATEHAHASE